MFFELREYRTWPGKRQEWVDYMEQVVIPFQVFKGMVVVGSFVGQDEDDLNVWIRRFEDEDELQRLHEAVHGSDTWQNEISPKVPSMMDRSRQVVRRIEATSRSVIQ